MADVVAPDRLELTPGGDEEMVQALPAYRPGPAFGERVRPGLKGART
jgi:hypothetical protein